MKLTDSGVWLEEQCRGTFTMLWLSSIGSKTEDVHSVAKKFTIWIAHQMSCQNL